MTHNGAQARSCLAQSPNCLRDFRGLLWHEELRKPLHDSCMGAVLRHKLRMSRDVAVVDVLLPSSSLSSSSSSLEAKEKREERETLTAHDDVTAKESPQTIHSYQPSVARSLFLAPSGARVDKPPSHGDTCNIS